MTIYEVSYLKYYENGALLGSNSWESFINYKLLNGKWDCDSSVEAKKALEKLYGECTYTDTLISPQSYVTLYIRNFHSELLVYNERYENLIVPNIYELKKRMINDGIAKEMGEIKNPSVWAYFLKNNNIKVHDFMLEFLHSVYTLPNFSCVCRGFNMGRYAKTEDNFIIALYHIRDYFENRNRKGWFINVCVRPFSRQIKKDKVPSELSPQ